MKVSYNWLQSHIVEKLPEPKELQEKLVFHAFEVESLEQKDDDVIFDIKILPDRAADCLSHTGIAREIAGLYGFTFKIKEYAHQTYPVNTEAVIVKTEKCRRYIAIKLNGISITKTPAWIQKRLESIGQTSINAVVDCANYVLFDIGQPIHIFDADKVDGGIVVREAHENEKVVTLADEEKNLPQGSIVVSDVLGVLAIAGVKGGKSAAVSKTTKNIIIEIANFDPVSVSKTSRKLGLLTDAAKRFENNYPAALASDAAREVLALVQEIVGGTVEWLTDIDTSKQEERTIAFTTPQINAVLGTNITSERIEMILKQYAYTFTHTEGTFVLSIPIFRPDIVGLHNVVEEIGRVYGYDNIPAVPITFPFPKEESQVFDLISKIKQYLANHGFIEVQTYTFQKKGELYVAYGPNDKSGLRANLSTALTESFDLNNRNAALFGVSKIKLFEVGTVFFTDHEELHIATIDAGVVQELKLEQFVELFPEIKTYQLQPSELKKPVHPFKPWSPFPFIVRDIAVWLKTEMDQKRLESIIANFAKEHCVREPFLFDLFTKDGRTSVAYRLVFQSMEKTLTDEDVEKLFSQLVSEIKNHREFEIR